MGEGGTGAPILQVRKPSTEVASKEMKMANAGLQAKVHQPKHPSIDL